MTLTPINNSTSLLTVSESDGDITLSNVHLDFDEDFANYAITVTPSAKKQVTLDLGNVVVDGPDSSSGKSFVKATGDTAITVDKSVISWSSIGESSSGGTFYLSGGADLSITNSLLVDAGLLWTTAASGQLLYATGTGTSVSIIDSVVFGATVEAEASLIQLEGGATLTMERSLLRADGSTTSSSLVNVSGSSTATLNDTLVVGESFETGDKTLLNSGADGTVTLNQTTLYAEKIWTAIGPDGSINLSSVVLTGSGDLTFTSNTSSVVSQNNAANSLSLLTLTEVVNELNRLVPESTITTPSVCWSSGLPESCVHELPVWPSLCSSTWVGVGDSARPVGFLAYPDQTSWWNTDILQVQAEYRAATWNRYYEAEELPDTNAPSAATEWEVTPCWDENISVQACNADMLLAPSAFRPDSWLTAQGQGGLAKCIPKAVDSDDPPDPVDSIDTGTYNPGGVSWGERTAPANLTGDGGTECSGAGCGSGSRSALILFPTLGLLVGLRRRAARDGRSAG